MARADVERILSEIGAAQHGVVTRPQLTARGIADSTVDWMVKSDRLVVLHRGIYQIGPVPLPHANEAAVVLACGADTRLSHLTAARLHRIVEPTRGDACPEVTVPRRRRPKLEGVKIHRVRDLLPDEVTTLHGIPVTTPARTLLDVAETMPARELEQALANALRMKLVTMAEMRAMVARHPKHRGAAPLRQILDAECEPAFTRSEAEEKLLEIVREAGLPRPTLNVRILHYEVDFVWASPRVIAEVDGYAYHRGARSFVADRQRDAELTAAGYRVLRFTWVDLTERRLATIVRLAQALARR